MADGLKRHLIVGLGSIGSKHAAILKAAGCCVAGIDPAVSSVPGLDIYPSLETGLAFEPDMIWLCTPTPLHAAAACEIVEKGVHLFIEKPVAHSVAAAKKILRTADETGPKAMVWVGCNMRFHPAVLKLKELIRQGVIGTPRVFRFHFSHWLPNMRPGVDYRQTYAVEKQGGGIILDNVHDIDLALMFSGSVKQICGIALKSGRLEMDAEDTACISLIHENRAMSFLQMDYLRKDKSRGIEILGDNGSLEWRSRGKHPESVQVNWFSDDNCQRKTIWEKQLDNFDDLFAAQFKAIQARALCQEDYRQGLCEGVEALRIALKARSALK
jgi:predicted dehydrogenase